MILLTACSSDPTAPVADQSTSTSIAASTTITAVEESAAEPSVEDSPIDVDATVVPALDDQIEFVTRLLNGQSVPTAEITARTSDAFRRQVPAAQFLIITQQLRSDASESWEATGRTIVAESLAVVDFDTDDGPWAMTIGVDPDGRINTAFLQPATEPDTPVAADLDSWSQSVAGDGRSYLVAEIIDGGCIEVASDGADRVVPIGSTFKLYVLGVLDAAIRSGAIEWHQALPIRDELKSLPSGVYQELPEGTERSVLRHAIEMIRVSDNTATDHLIDLVGRANIEAELTALGNSVPDRNTPFLTTAELFALKLQVDDNDREDFIALDAAAKRSALAELTLDQTNAIGATAGWITPRDIEALEWFATPNDQCALLDELMTTGTPETRQLLSFSTGGVGAEDFAHVAYKGGSEPGVLNLAWHVTRLDGRRFVVVVNAADAESAFNDATVAAAATSVFDVIANID